MKSVYAYYNMPKICKTCFYLKCAQLYTFHIYDNVQFRGNKVEKEVVETDVGRLNLDKTLDCSLSNIFSELLSKRNMK
jgi:hypothetical protein